MNYRFLLFTIFYCSLNCCAKGQNQPFIPKILPNSPNSASFARFGDYKVSLFSGLPQISLPLYNISVNGLEVPITLDYHASGIKVTDFASWAGSGWNIIAGGQIRRKLMGTPDEEEDGYLTGQTRYSGNININTYDGINYLNQAYSGNIDVEPDIFSYDFPGKSGKFFFNKDNGYKPGLLPYAPLRIDKNWASNKLTFNILDEHGNAYSFGNSVETTQSSYAGVNTTGTSAWMLDEMISADKADTISFSYNPNPSVTLEDLIDTWVVDDDVTFFADNPDDDIPGYLFLPDPAASITSTYVSATVYERCLNEIQFKNGKIVFELSPVSRQDFFNGTFTSKALSKIKVYNYNYSSNQYQLIKTIAFFQSYFISGSDVFTKRLRLDSIQIQDKNNTSVESYRFDYNNSISLPQRNSKARDFWGYFNGKANSSLIPMTLIDYVQAVNGGGDARAITIGSNVPDGRDPNPSFMQAAILKRIYYPTKGFTDFEYETNKYKDLQNNIKYAGGLRIKSIKSYDGIINTPLVKTYKYGVDESGTGRENFILSNYYLKNTQKYKRYVMFSAGLGLAQTKRTRTYLSSPNIEIEAYDAAPVVYPVVTEYTGDEINNVGKTVYQYRDYPDVITSASFARPNITSYFYRRGQLLNKKVFKRSGSSGYQPVQEDVFTYTAFPESVYFGGLVIKQNEVGGNFFPPGYDRDDAQNWLFSNYSITSDDNYQTSQTTISYNPDDTRKFVKTTTSLNYDNIIHQQPTKIITTGSKGYITKEVYKYPADYINTGNTMTSNPVLDTMLAKNMQAAVIEKVNTLTKPSGIESITNGQLNVYRRLTSGAIVKDNLKQLVPDAPITDFQPSSVSSKVLESDSRYKTMINFDTYDALAKINQYTVKNVSTTSYLWDYGGNLPIAEIKNATVINAAYTSFEADGKGNWTFTGAPVSDPTAPTGNKAYSLTIETPLSKSGLSATTTYIVSYWTKNASAFTIAGTQPGFPVAGDFINGWKYFEHRITGETTVSIIGTGLIDEVRLYPATSQMVTMTYEPLTGLTSQCDAANHISYFGYDAYGRLLLQKDQNKNIIKTYNYQFKK